MMRISEMIELLEHKRMKLGDVEVVMENRLHQLRGIDAVSDGTADDKTTPIVIIVTKPY